MLIEQATVPTVQDKRFSCLFERMPFGHETIDLARWTTSQGTIRYLGHTHPEDYLILILLVSIERNGISWL